METKTVADEVRKPVKARTPLTFVNVISNEYFLYVLSFIAFLLIWDWVAKEQILGKSLATPYEVAKELGRLMTVRLAGKNLWGHIWDSTRRVFIGFAIASVFAVPIGLLMALNRYINALVKPVFDIFKPMPPIAWVSIAILWFGIDEGSKIFIIIIGAFVPCLLNSYNGARLIEPELYDVVRMLGGHRRDEIIQVCFPAAFPAIFAGLQISISMAWSCVLAAELVSSRSGLGWIIIQGMRLTRPDLVIGGMVLIAMVAWFTSLLVSGLEKLICPWKRGIESL
jgi:ABC-type nitrate/sulfonate/bicarbonate transport system permease component